MNKAYDSASGDKYCGQQTEAAACTRSDVSVCCREKATCSSIASVSAAFCKYDEVYAAANGAIHCAGLTCTKEADAGLCCAAKAKCSATVCGKHRVLRADAASLLCAGISCRATDAPTCCQATCSHFDELPGQGCDPEEEVRDDSKLCIGFSCAQRDQVTLRVRQALAAVPARATKEASPSTE